MITDGKEIDQRLNEVVFGENREKLQMPPPVFLAMRGEFVGFAAVNKILTARFPVLDEQLNPYGSMQGGMIAAAIDNTIGPLSLLVAPPSFTRRLEVKYRRSITPDLGLITVTAKFVEQKKRQLFFTARVSDDADHELATAKAVHWIV